MKLGMEVEDHSDFVDQLVADGRIALARLSFVPRTP
jgi:hypothetical protein